MALRILVTGANGFIGQRLVRLLTSARQHVSGVALEAGPLGQSGNIEYRQLDITDQAGIGALFEQNTFDAVVHLAALVHVRDPRLSFDDYARVNFLASESIFHAAAAHSVKRFAFASTVEVYGAQPPNRLVDEATPCRPESDYARTKLLAERSLGRIAERCGMAYANLRLAPVYSHDFRLNLDKRVYLRAPTLAFTIGRGDYRIGMCSIANIEHWVARWLELPNPPSGAYNLADARAPTANELIALERVHNRARWLARLPAAPCLAAIVAREAVMSLAGRDIGMFTAANFRKLRHPTGWDITRAEAVVGQLPGDVLRDLYPDTRPLDRPIQ